MELLKEIKTIRGRVVTTGTWWWSQQPVVPFNQKLYCIHNILLTRNCEECGESWHQ